MNSENWEHPFVDLFRLAKAAGGSGRSGNVEFSLDPELEIKVYTISGEPTANSIEIPNSKTKQPSLGLTGKFLYLMLEASPEGPFTITAHYKIRSPEEEDSFSLILSNSFKEIKLDENYLKFPVIVRDKWTVVFVNVLKAFEKYISSNIKSLEMTKIKVSSQVKICGIFTSEQTISPEKLQKALNTNPAAAFDWLELSHTEKQTEEEKKKSFFEDSLDISEQYYKDPSFNVEEASKIKVKKESFDKEDTLLSLTKSPVAKPIQEVMKPDPIMKLRSIIGYTNSRNNIKWTKNSTNLTVYEAEFKKGSKYFLIYPSGENLVMINPATKKQEFRTGHTNNINTLVISEDGSLVATGQEGKKPLVLIWELKTRREPTSLAFKEINEVKQLAFSDTGKFLCVEGLDRNNRELITIWDISEVNSGVHPVQIARQISNFHINTIKFFPKEETKLASCGKENIRFWTVKKQKNITGFPIRLDHHGREVEFLDLDFDFSEKVLITSSKGLVFQINYTLEPVLLDGAFELHESSIESIVVNEKVCVTGSSDCNLQIWNADFSGSILEAHPEDEGITAIDISPDGSQIAFGNVKGDLGILDLTSNAYRILVRSHLSDILTLDVHPNNELILTASSDNTIRLWNVSALNEIHEFTSPEDWVKCLSFHPNMNTFACGFETGTVQIFEIEGNTYLNVMMQHELSVVKLAHSPNGKLLISADFEGNVVAYDIFRKYQVVKVIPVEISGDYVDACFSPDSKQIAVIGQLLSTIALWDVATFQEKFRINSYGTTVQKIAFSPNGQDLLAVTAGIDYKVKFYGLNGFEAILLKEFTGLHPKAEIKDISISPNAKYLLTGSNDRIIKVWDYSARPHQLQGQGFISHSKPIKQIVFSQDCSKVFTLSEGVDGIFVWDFFGIETPLEAFEHPAPKQAVKVIEEESFDDLLATVKTIPEKGSGIMVPLPEEYSPPRHRKQDSFEFHKSPPRFSPLPSDCKLNLTRVVGFELFKDNLIWAAEKGWYMFASGNFVVQTLLREENEERFFRAPVERLVKIAVDFEFRTLVGGGIRGEEYVLYVWDINSGNAMKELAYTMKEGSVLNFSPDGSELLSLSNEDKLLLIWDWNQGRVKRTEKIDGVEELYWIDKDSFISVGSSIVIWKEKGNKIEKEVLASKKDFTCSCFVGDSLFVGTPEGKALVFNMNTRKMVYEAYVYSGKITHLEKRSSKIVVGGEANHLVSFSPTHLSDTQEILTLDGHTLSLVLQNDEGIVMTKNGTIWYINWVENSSFRIASTHFSDIKSLASGPFIASASVDKSVRIWETSTYNELFHEALESLVCNVLLFHQTLPLLVAGLSDGSLRFYDFRRVKLLGKSKIFSAAVTQMAWKGENIVIGSEAGDVCEISAEDWSNPNIVSELIVKLEEKICCIDTYKNFLIVVASSLAVYSESEKIDEYFPDVPCEIQAKFISNSVLAFIEASSVGLYLREFKKGEIQKIDLDYEPVCLGVELDMFSYILLGTEEGMILLHDMEFNDTEEYPAHSSAINSLEVLPHGLLTASSHSFLCWNLIR